MVDLGEIQAAYYMVAATGVLVAAAFYVINLRETTKNRKATLTTTLMQSVTSEEGVKKFVSLMNMKWADFDDFVKKYDSRVNEDSYARRVWLWCCWETLGYQYKTGLVDIETLYNVCGDWIVLSWFKFQPVIYGMREKGEFSEDSFKNFEYLAVVISKMREARDPSFKANASIALSSLSPEFNP